MNLPTTLLLVGLAYTVLFGGLSLMRREGLSAQFAFEATAITVILSGLTALTGFPTHPVFFLAILYLVTMRIRLLVDVGNYLARRGKFSSAEGVYRLAERLWPDRSGRLIIEINRGTLCLQQGALDEAIHTFKSILEKAGQGYLGVKHEAAAHYNLGHAYRRKDMEA
jgi:tetratricopeptide (TPR) repeat protein